MFYMDVRYEGDRTNEVDLILTDDLAAINSSTNLMGRLSTLLLWHAEDPVDDAEKLRNDLIFSRYQGNRNPFIDHPEWVDLIFKPRLEIVFSPETITVSWPGQFTNYVLQTASQMNGSWSPAPGTNTLTANYVHRVLPVTNNFRFFRLVN